MGYFHRHRKLENTLDTKNAMYSHEFHKLNFYVTYFKKYGNINIYFSNKDELILWYQLIKTYYPEIKMYKYQDYYKFKIKID